MTWKSGDTVGTFLRRIGATGALLEVEARQVSRALRGDLNRVINAESANLQRAVGAAGRQIAAIDELDARAASWPSSRTSSGSVAEARRETPEATLAELAERLGIHRSAVQRALERIERLALTPADGPVAGADAVDRSGAAPIGPKAAGTVRIGGLWHDRGHAPRRHRRQLEDEHHAGRRRRAARSRSPAGPAFRASPASSARRSSASPPFVTRSPARTSRSAPRTSITSWPAPTPARSRAPMLAGLATWVIVGHTERRREPARPTS